jgi:DNA-binding transcriptional regulator YiaG
MRIVKSKINPEILKWWREQLNLDIDLAAKKLNFKVKTLEMWES